MNTAEIILEQLGGSKFLAMTGAKNLVGGREYLTMTLRKNISKANRLTITLNVNDTYTMEFYKYTAPRMDKKTYKFVDAQSTPIETFQDVYCDQLSELFTQVTGMYTSL